MTSHPNPLTQLSLDDLRARTSVKWRRYEPDVLPLWVAEMDVPLAEPVKRALIEMVERSDTGYTLGGDYVDAFTGFAARRWGWDVPAESVVPVADVITGYTDAFLTLLDPGDHVVVLSPVYGPFYSYLRQAGLRVREAPLTADWRPDLVALDAALSAASEKGRKAGVLLCHPHNPTGSLFTAEELRGIADVAAAHGAPVVSDEIHAPLVYADREFVPYATVDPTGLALHSASKTWSLPGLKGALLIAGAEAGDFLERYRSGTHAGATQAGAIAQAAAYREGADFHEALLLGLDENRRLMAELVAEQLPGVTFRMPEATYFAWLGFGDLLGKDPSEPILEKARVALNPGPWFGTGGDGHARLNLATSPEIITEAVTRIGRLLREG